MMVRMRLNMVAVFAGIALAMSGYMVASASAKPSTTAFQSSSSGKSTSQKAVKRHPRSKYYHLVMRAPWRIRSAFIKIGRCESTNNIRIRSKNGLFFGWLQFTRQTWQDALGYKDMPHQASKYKQWWAGIRLVRIQGWGAWPVCSVKAGVTHLSHNFKLRPFKNSR